MRLFSLAFLLGVVVLQQFASLPSLKWASIIFIISLVLFFLKKTRIFAGFGLGFAWGLCYAHFQIAAVLPTKFEGKTITATGYIASIPQASSQLTSFLFSVKNFQLDNVNQNVHGLVRLSWRANNFEIHVGDKWQLKVRLKKIHSTMNPGGFDYEAWAMQDGIYAAGYVVTKEENKFLNSHWYHYPLDRVREYLQNKIEKNLPHSATSPWIFALTLGEHHGISAENWEVLRNTGTNHLMAIAGLHIGFMSGFAAAITIWLWRRIPQLVIKFPAQHAGASAAMLVAIIYSAMAGFSLPTQRACITLIVFLVVMLLRRKINAWQAWSIALLLVLCLNPMSVLTESFWLSFGAVALIIYSVSNRLVTSKWWKWARIQYALTLGLIPFSFWLFQQFSFVSFLANCIAIPWVGMVIVPLCLLGVFCLMWSDKIGGLILFIADKLLSLLWIILTWLAHMPWSTWYHCVPNDIILITACIGIVIILLPKGFPGRYLGIIWLLPLLLYKPLSPKLGDVSFTLLDVGQGLSAVVQTRNHILVFDTGPKLNSNFDMGESVVVPFLHTLDAKHIDMLVVSHGDNDHIGGAPAVLHHFPVLSVKTSVPEKLVTPVTTYCLRGEKWQWDGVDFQFLYPTLDHLGLDNDSSCVLHITSHQKNILLTGDIEKFAEKILVNLESSNLPSTILVAPHHGSKTSAVDEFLQLVKPMYVLFPIGYRNRYHFPHPTVVEKYDDLGTKKLDTAEAGAIQFVISDSLSKPLSYRVLKRHYWNN